MTTLDKLKATPIWDARYDLPTFPAYNNPWVYMGFIDLMLRLQDGKGLDREKIKAHFKACDPDGDGLFERWPNGAGGSTSHDEITGAAYFDPEIAESILNYLEQHDGDFNNKTEERLAEYFNVFRLPFIRPFLMAAANRPRVGLISQALWSIHIIADAFGKLDEHGTSGRLRIWLMADKMRRYPLCKLAIQLWLSRLNKKGLTLKSNLGAEPGRPHYPMLEELITADFSWPDNETLGGVK